MRAPREQRRERGLELGRTEAREREGEQVRIPRIP